MLFLIDEYRDFELAKETLPNFRDVRPQDLDTLILEICLMVHNFGEISFFQGLPKLIWLQFCEKMEKRVYLPGDMIYHEGGKATHFYVIKKGTVWALVSSVDSDFYPFMEISSFFGAHEALNAMKNPWNIMAKTKTVIFAMKIEDFRKIFEKTKYF